MADQPARRLHTVDSTADQLSIGRSKLYELHRRGELQFVRIGRRNYVEDTEIARYLDRLRTA